MVLPLASMLSWEVLTAFIFLFRQFSKGASDVQPLWYNTPEVLCFTFRSKYILVLSTVLVGHLALGSVLLMGPNLLQQIFEAVLVPFDLFWSA